MSAAALFVWLQDAAFYRDFHIAAADLIGAGCGRTWLDVGTGPGLLARIAADNDFSSVGIDRDSAMIEAARRISAMRDNGAEFRTADIVTELASGRRYDVVSASSVLVTTREPVETIEQLRSLTAPSGRLLIIEASPLMSRRRALDLFTRGQLGRRGYMLLLWAMARSGRALDEVLIQRAMPQATHYRLAHGLVNAWVLNDPPTTERFSKS